MSKLVHNCILSWKLDFFILNYVLKYDGPTDVPEYDIKRYLDLGLVKQTNNGFVGTPQGELLYKYYS